MNTEHCSELCPFPLHRAHFFRFLLGGLMSGSTASFAVATDWRLGGSQVLVSDCLTSMSGRKSGSIHSSLNSPPGKDSGSGSCSDSCSCFCSFSCTCSRYCSCSCSCSPPAASADSRSQRKITKERAPVVVVVVAVAASCF
jgi:hypothetical protein